MSSDKATTNKTMTLLGYASTFKQNHQTTDNIGFTVSLNDKVIDLDVRAVRYQGASSVPVEISVADFKGLIKMLGAVLD